MMDDEEYGDQGIPREPGSPLDDLITWGSLGPPPEVRAQRGDWAAREHEQRNAPQVQPADGMSTAQYKAPVPTDDQHLDAYAFGPERTRHLLGGQFPSTIPLRPSVARGQQRELSIADAAHDVTSDQGIPVRGGGYEHLSRMMHYDPRPRMN